MIKGILLIVGIALLSTCNPQTIYLAFNKNRDICNKDGYPIDSSSNYFPAKIYSDTIPAVFTGKTNIPLFSNQSKKDIAEELSVDITTLKDTFETRNDTFLLKYLSYSLFKMHEPVLYDHYLNKDIYRLFASRAFNPALIIRIEKDKNTVIATIKKLNKGIGYPFIVYAEATDELPYTPPDIGSFDSLQNKFIIHDSIKYKKLVIENKRLQDSFAKEYNVIDYHLILDSTFSVPKITWDSIQKFIDSTQFWSSKPDFANHYLQFDGSRWILEGQNKYGYQIKSIPSPNFDNSPYKNIFDPQDQYVRLFKYLIKTAHLEKERQY